MPVKTDVYRDSLERLRRGEVEQVRQELEAAWRQTPDSVEVMHALALALDLAGERTRATELLEQAHARAPTEPAPACDLALLLLEHSQDARAERVLAPAVEAHPEDTRTQLCMAMALAKTDPLRASEHARRALQDADPERHRQAEALLQALVSMTDNRP
jgi:Tfp pilus assembly protein PilF